MKRNILLWSALLATLIIIIYFSQIDNLQTASPSSKSIQRIVPSNLDSRLPLNKIVLPEGFNISIFAYPVENARSMSLSPGGVLYVGTRTGMVYAIPDRDNDNRADEIITIARNLNSPNGVAYKDKNLYVAEINRVIRFENIESSLNNPPEPIVVNDQFPNEGHHGWKFIRFGPDGKLYVPIGAPCNICNIEYPYAGIMRMNQDGSQLEQYAQGVRNTVGFDWSPETKELWFTDNGRDNLGEDIPPDELNYAPSPGMHFGYPYCHGRDIQDPEFNNGNDCSQFTPAAQELGPHVASLGMRFYTSSQFPKEYQGGIFIAEHGSWNRKIPIGYRVTFVKLKANKPISYEVFAEGWLQESGAWGRPVDVLVMPDGSLLVSDDKGNAIYRITYTG